MLIKPGISKIAIYPMVTKDRYNMKLCYHLKEYMLCTLIYTSPFYCYYAKCSLNKNTKICTLCIPTIWEALEGKFLHMLNLKINLQILM